MIEATLLQTVASTFTFTAYYGAYIACNVLKLTMKIEYIISSLAQASLSRPLAILSVWVDDLFVDF
jgi:hypothetical protein